MVRCCSCSCAYLSVLSKQNNDVSNSHANQLQGKKNLNLSPFRVVERALEEANEKHTLILGKAL